MLPAFDPTKTTFLKKTLKSITFLDGQVSQNPLFKNTYPSPYLPLKAILSKKDKANNQPHSLKINKLLYTMKTCIHLPILPTKNPMMQSMQ